MQNLVGYLGLLPGVNIFLELARRSKEIGCWIIIIMNHCQFFFPHLKSDKII